MFLIQSKINRSGFYRKQQGRVMWFVAQCLIHYLEYVCLWFVFIFPFLCRLSQINSYLLLFFVTGCHSLLFLHHLCWYWLRFWLFTVFSGLVSTNPWWGCENYFTILLLTLFQHYKFTWFAQGLNIFSVYCLPFSASCRDIVVVIWI